MKLTRIALILCFFSIGAEMLGQSSPQVNDMITLDKIMPKYVDNGQRKWANLQDASEAIYGGNTENTGGRTFIKFSSGAGSIVSTTTGGKIKAVEVSWTPGMNTSTRVIYIYGKNTPYDSESELYDVDKQGELIGTIGVEETKAIIPGDYLYVGIRQNAGGVWLDDITFTWDKIKNLDENNKTMNMINDRFAEVTLTRSMREGSWNTFCVPFDMTAEDIAANFGTGAEVKELTGVSAEGETYSLVFSDVTVITRNKPCLVKPTQAVSTIATGEKDVVIGGAEPAVNVTDGNGHSVTFHGNYTSMMVPRDAFFISNNSFYLADSDVTLKGFRGYFTIDGNATAKEMNICFGESDGIVRTESTAQYNQAYNLAGQRVSGDAKGMIIVNGRKVFNK